SLAELPVELWYEILAYLALADLKRLRLLSRDLQRISTPSCFQQVLYELSRASVERILEIAKRKELAQNVQKLVLRTTQGLREFGSFREWERSIALPDDPRRGSISDDNCEEKSLESLMSYQWSALSESEKRVLYAEYEADRKELEQRVRHRTSTSTEGAPALEQFDEAIANFSNPDTFNREPGFLFDNCWGTHWRQLRISQSKLLMHTTGWEDEDVEALQLSIVLRALGWAQQFQAKLRSASFYVGGSAFWGPNRMRRLW
ncbi:uncharacterized protein BDR25DRAFT_242876, partial [Lindgomyces ingoldianus]